MPFFSITAKEKNPGSLESRLPGFPFIIPILFRLTLNKAEKCFFSAEYVANFNNFSAIFSVK